MNIAVVGTGYVGLVTGTCFAETGNNVICVDNNEAKVQTLKAGRIPIYEPGLDVLFERNMKEKRLHFTTDLREAVEKSTLIFLASAYTSWRRRQCGPILCVRCSAAIGRANYGLSRHS